LNVLKNERQIRGLTYWAVTRNQSLYSKLFHLTQ
jgi:hypothetical protein